MSWIIILYKLKILDWESTKVSSLLKAGRLFSLKMFAFKAKWEIES